MAHVLSFHDASAARRRRSSQAGRILRTLAQWRQRARDRAALRQLLMRADDRMLADVGLTRATLADRAGRPFWQA